MRSFCAFLPFSNIQNEEDLRSPPEVCRDIHSSLLPVASVRQPFFTSYRCLFFVPSGRTQSLFGGFSPYKGWGLSPLTNQSDADKLSMLLSVIDYIPLGTLTVLIGLERIVLERVYLHLYLKNGIRTSRNGLGYTFGSTTTPEGKAGDRGEYFMYMAPRIGAGQLLQG